MSARRTVAFGLQLESTFALPGMEPRVVEGLPSLSIELTAPPRLKQRWSGRAAAPEWTGRLGDGELLRIERNAAGERLFSYGERAQFLLDSSGEMLSCAPSQGGLAWQRTLLGKVLPAVSVMRGYEALHAAALECPYGAVAITAPSGAGKSSLALELITRGWALLSDDVLVLSPTPTGVRAHPGTPHLTVAYGSRLAASGRARTIGVLGGERWMSVPGVCERACPVHAVVQLVHDPAGVSALELLDRNPMRLAPFMLGVGADRTRRESRFSLYAALAERALLMRLRRGADDEPGVLADMLEDALAQERVEPVAGAA
jgi:hypothetical protein